MWKKTFIASLALAATALLISQCTGPLSPTEAAEEGYGLSKTPADDDGLQVWTGPDGDRATVDLDPVACPQAVECCTAGRMIARESITQESALAECQAVLGAGGSLLPRLPPLGNAVVIAPIDVGDGLECRALVQAMADRYGACPPATPAQDPIGRPARMRFDDPSRFDRVQPH